MTKHKYLLLLAPVILFASCTITKRKYLPGYAIEHVRKSANTNNRSEYALSQTRIKTAVTKTLDSKELHLLTNNLPDNNPAHFTLLANSNIVQTGKRPNAIESSTLDAPILNTKAAFEIPSDSMKAVMAARVCKQAKASQHLGMFALTLTLISFAAWVLIQASINSGAKWATAMLASYVVAGGVIAGGILAILAIIFAIVAFHKIHEEQGKYTGTGKAVGGIIFAVILFGVLALLALNIH